MFMCSSKRTSSEGMFEIREGRRIDFQRCLLLLVEKSAVKS